MKRNGFTLVELLAVIAIPNIVGLFNNAKKSSFENELKTIFKQAEQEWIASSMFSSEEKIYSSCLEGDCGESLKLNGRQDIEYYIKLDTNGKVINYYVTDGKYQYTYSGEGLKITEIDNVLEVDESNKIDITSSGVSGTVIIADCRLKSGNINQQGSEIVCGTEHFYVLSTKNNKVRMIAAKNITLTTSNPIQTDVFSPTYFSSTPYWYDQNNEVIKVEYRSNDNYVYDSNSNLYKYVEAYVNTLKSMGRNDVTGELISLSDIRNIPTVQRRESMKRLINIMRPSEYQEMIEQAYSLFTLEEREQYIDLLDLDRLYDYNTFTEEEKAIGLLFIYNSLSEADLLTSSEIEIYNYVSTLIADYNAYNDWLPEWIYDGKDYYSGNAYDGNNFIYPWKADWDGGASYSDQTGYSIRPVITIAINEIIR